MKATIAFTIIAITSAALSAPVPDLEADACLRNGGWGTGNCKRAEVVEADACLRNGGWGTGNCKRAEVVEAKVVEADACLRNGGWGTGNCKRNEDSAPSEVAERSEAIEVSRPTHV
jgi:hypothetical protein